MSNNKVCFPREYFELESEEEIRRYLVKKYVPIHIYDSMCFELELEGKVIVRKRGAA
jgi:hypothetical protein